MTINEKVKEQFDNASYVIEHKGCKVSFHNELPPNFREITLEEFAQSHFFTYMPQRIDHRQCFRTEDGLALSKMLPVTLYFMHDGTGYGIEQDFWGKTLRFYKFGCNHNYVEMLQAECKALGIYHGGNCYHVSKCLDCGEIMAVDSSD